MSQAKGLLGIWWDVFSPGVLGLWSARAEHGTRGDASSWFSAPLRAGVAAQAEQRDRQSDPIGPQCLTTACHLHWPCCHPGEWRLTHTNRYRRKDVLGRACNFFSFHTGPRLFMILLFVWLEMTWLKFCNVTRKLLKRQYVNFRVFKYLQIELQLQWKKSRLRLAPN